MACDFQTQRRIEFADTDMAGIVHFSNFFRYMESAEHAFFRSLGLTLHTREPGEMRGWARVDAQCEYLRPLIYQDLVQIRLWVVDKSASSLSYRFEFRTNGAEELSARGSLKVVHVARGPQDQRMRAAIMPPEIDEKIQVAAP